MQPAKLRKRVTGAKTLILLSYSMNNGVEAMSKTLKYNYLPRGKT